MQNKAAIVLVFALLL